jgi:multicomponent Na+:H+ antiporter subunit E
MLHAGASLWVAALLLVFWILLSGKFDVVHIGAGAVAALFVAFATRPLRRMHPVIGRSVERPLQGIHWGHALLFVPFMAAEIAISSVQVAAMVLHPRMPIAPRVLRFRTALPHPLARLTLANAITLTPGTVTIDVEGDDLVVHALTATSARGVEVGKIRAWVGRIFGGQPDRPTVEDV